LQKEASRREQEYKEEQKQMTAQLKAKHRQQLKELEDAHAAAKATIKTEHRQRVKELEGAYAAAKATIKDKDKVIKVQCSSHFVSFANANSHFASTCSVLVNYQCTIWTWPHQ
jgi:F0F1-type ATP synthase membrane subunit b/b'